MRATVCLPLVLGASLVSAADMNALQGCRRILDQMTRLACYDALIAMPAAAPGAERGRGTASQSPPSSAPPAAAIAPMASAPNEDIAFGLENRPMPARQVEALESVIPGRFHGWVPRQRFRLANGQVWEISDGSQAAYELRDTRIRITRGFSGTFFMHVDGVSQTPRVRRVE